MQAILIRATKVIGAERQISILVTEQYARPVLPIVDYAFILENGAAVMEGTRQELLNNPDVRAAYFRRIRVLLVNGYSLFGNQNQSARITNDRSRMTDNEITNNG